jgi:membrane dipeptidase
MEAEGELAHIRDINALEKHVKMWMDSEDTKALPIGYILSLEGADSILEPEYLAFAYDQGLRALGPAHYGPGRYAQGTNATGGLGAQGIRLLKEMERLNIILDATHLCDESFWEAMDNYSGAVWASHHNCRALVNHNRQFDDDQLKELISRGAVIGGVMDAWMVVPDWVRGVSTPSSTNCSLERLVDHMDHICQLAGNANHIGIGSDLDGGFGKEQCPVEIETIADVRKIPQILSNRGYSAEDIQKVMHGNWLRFLRNVWK